MNAIIHTEAMTATQRALLIDTIRREREEDE